MRLTLRRQVRQRDRFRCVYCGVTEEEAGAELTIDHFQPVRHGGDDTLENLVYACHACNEFKGDFWSADPATSLLHPGRDAMEPHVVEDDDGRLVGLTERGYLYIEALHLNRPPLVAHRQERWRTQRAQQRQQQMEERLARVEQRLAWVEAAFGLKPGESDKGSG